MNDSSNEENDEEHSQQLTEDNSIPPSLETEDIEDEPHPSIHPTVPEEIEIEVEEENDISNNDSNDSSDVNKHSTEPTSFSIYSLTDRMSLELYQDILCGNCLWNIRLYQEMNDSILLSVTCQPLEQFAMSPSSLVHAVEDEDDDIYSNENDDEQAAIAAVAALSDDDDNKVVCIQLSIKTFIDGPNCNRSHFNHCCIRKS